MHLPPVNDKPHLDSWFPPEGAAEPSYAARHRVVATVREVAALLLAVDMAAAPADALAALETAAEQLRDRTAALPARSGGASLALSPPPDGALVERSPVSGRANVLAPPLRYAFDGDRTRAWAVFSRVYEGPPGGVHGGMVAAALDEVLGVAQMASDAVGFTGTLTVRYHRLTPLETRVDYEAGVSGREGRKLEMWARSTADGVLLAEAQGLFITQVATGEMPVSRT